MSSDTAVERIEGRLLDWFFTEASVMPLAVARIGLGLVAFWSTVGYLPHMEWLWGEHGFLAESLVSYRTHPLRFHTDAVFGTILVSSACLTIGLATRASGLVAAASMAILGSSGYSHTWGWGTVMPAVLAITALSPARNAWSFDAWWAARRGAPQPLLAPAWALRLLQMHVVVVYLSASWHRVNDRGWLHGEMVYAAFANGMYSRYPYVDPQPFKPIFWVLSHATEWLEVTAPVALWWRPTRTFYVFALMGLHLGLELSAIVGWWQPMMMVLLVVFLPPESLRRWLPDALLPAGAPQRVQSGLGSGAWTTRDARGSEERKR